MKKKQQKRVQRGLVDHICYFEGNRRSSLNTLKNKSLTLRILELAGKYNRPVANEYENKITSFAAIPDGLPSQSKLRGVFAARSISVLLPYLQRGPKYTYYTKSYIYTHPFYAS